MMKLEILTPEKQLFKGNASSVTLPGKAGKFTILPYHAPLIASLGEGTLKFISELNEFKIPIQGGVVEVSENQVIVCVDSI